MWRPVSQRRWNIKCPDGTVVDQAAEEKTFVNFLVPWDRNMVTKKDEKITNESPQEKEIRKMHWVLTKIAPLVVGCLGVVSGWLLVFL